MTNWDQHKRSEVTSPLITTLPVRAFSRWLCQMSRIHLHRSQWDGHESQSSSWHSHTKDNNERRERNFDDKRGIFVWFLCFPVLFGVVSFLTATDPRYNPQHNHLPSINFCKSLLRTASTKSCKPSPHQRNNAAQPGSQSQLGLTSWCSSYAHSHSQRPMCTTAVAIGAPSAHPAMLKAHSKCGSLASIMFNEETLMPRSSEVDEGRVVLNRVASRVDFGRF